MTRKHLSQADKQLLAKAKAELVNPERAFRAGHKDDLRGEVLIARYRGHCRRSERPIAEGSDVAGMAITTAGCARSLPTTAPLLPHLPAGLDGLKPPEQQRSALAEDQRLLQAGLPHLRVAGVWATGAHRGPHHPAGRVRGSLQLAEARCQ